VKAYGPEEIVVDEKSMYGFLNGRPCQLKSEFNLLDEI
jgi:hypothetical protein